MKVRISTRTVGVNFATAGCVYEARPFGRKIHETKDFPLGCCAAAVQAAQQWCDDQGHTIVEEV
jgi:hypothetical protein